MALAEHIVADAGAFLRGAALQEIGRCIYTTREVVAEIRDKATRRRLAVLPYELHFRQPFPEYVRLVTEFSKKTGDYPSLSATDIQVLALTYQLEAEKLPGKEEKRPLAVESGEPADTAGLEAAEFSSFLFWRSPLPSIEEDLQGLLGLHPLPLDPEGQVSDGEESGEEGGWITPGNIQQVQEDFGWGETPMGVEVACVTTDFAMQNVLLQMGLRVLTPKGLLIRHTRSHLLRCHACFKTTSDVTRLFCRHCGNKTLKKVAVTVEDNGSVHLHFSQNPKVLNPRGLRFSLPAPQGGKHALNPHLTEDQRFPQQRLSRKARQKNDVFDPDYIAGASPFADNDIYSRAASLQIRDAAVGAGRRRLNPNASRKRFQKKR